MATREVIAELKAAYDSSEPIRMFNAILDAEVELRKGDWQPIDTAPKDGTRVLIGWRGEGGQWNERRAWFEDEFDIVGVDDSGQTKWSQEWTDDAVVSFGYEEVQSYNPTHWMPLPSPPDAPKAQS